MSYTCLHYHIVFATKERRPFVDEAMMPRLAQYIGGIIRGFGGKLLQCNGPGDHIHLAALLPATRGLADMIRDIKSNSSSWVHDEFESLRVFGWQDGYAAFSVSQSGMPAVVNYIRRQKEHHHEMTFEEELAKLLERHEISFDPKYL